MNDDKQFNRVRKLARMFLMIALFCLVAIDSAVSAQSSPSFGEHVGVLFPPEDAYTGRIMNLWMTPNGSHIYGFSAYSLSASGIEVKHFLWDLRGLTLPEPITILEPDFLGKVDVDGPYPVSISPNSGMVALALNDEVQVLEFPGMNIYRTFPDVDLPPLSTPLNWSTDSRRLLVQERDQFTLWALESDSITQQALDFENMQCLVERKHCRFAEIRNIGDHWFLLPLGGPDFIVCTQDMQTCEQYERSKLSSCGSVIAPNGEVIIIESHETGARNSELHVWTHDDNLEYEFTRSVQFDEQLCLHQFSPNLDNLVARNGFDLAILNYPELEIVQHVENGNRVAWLPDSQHFLVFSYQRGTLELYAVEQSTPIDMLELRALPPVDERWPWDEWQLAIDEAGETIMLNLGRVALIVPLVAD